MTLWQKSLAGWVPPIAAIALIWAALFLYLGDKRSRLLEGGATTTANPIPSDHGHGNPGRIREAESASAGVPRWEAWGIGVVAVAATAFAAAETLAGNRSIVRVANVGLGSGFGK